MCIDLKTHLRPMFVRAHYRGHRSFSLHHRRSVPSLMRVIRGNLVGRRKVDISVYDHRCF